VPDNCVLDIVCATDPQLCGAKASGLARLERAGFNVPRAICLTTDFYRRWLVASGLAACLAEVIKDPRPSTLRELRVRAETSTVPANLAVALHERIAHLRAGWDGALTVRSSHVIGDDADPADIGGHASFVLAERNAASVNVAIKRCWASLWTESAWRSRDDHGISHTQAGMAVVIQRFLASDRAGVASSDTSFDVVGHEAVLTAPQALHLARLVRTAERAFGAPVDVEWMFDAGRFWAVQVRAKTAEHLSAL